MSHPPQISLQQRFALKQDVVRQPRQEFYAEFNRTCNYKPPGPRKPIQPLASKQEEGSKIGFLCAALTRIRQQVCRRHA